MHIIITDYINQLISILSEYVSFFDADILYINYTLKKEVKMTESEHNKEASNKLASLDFKKASVTDVKVLLQDNADINIKDTYNETPLIKALLADNLEVASFLIEQGADVTSKSLTGYTPMMICAQKGFVSVAKALLPRGNSISQTYFSNRASLLSIAVWANQAEMVQFLLSEGALVNAVDKLGWTPLMISAYQGNCTIAKILLDHGADKYIRQEMGWQARDFAYFYKHDDIVTLLDSY